MKRKESDIIVQEVAPTSPKSPPNLKSFKQLSTLDVHRQVGVKLRIQLDFVDDINEEIFLNLLLSFHFDDPEAAKFITGDPGFAIVAPSESDINVPNLEILNTRSCEHKEGFKYLVCTQTGTVFVYRLYRVSIQEKLKLARFPFDRQIFKCKLKSYNGMLTNWNVPISRSPVGVKSDKLWSKHDVIVDCERNLWHLDWVKCYSDSKKVPSVFSVELGMTRSSGFYMLNFVLITFLVVGSSISCLAIDRDEFADRASITFTIMLTMIAVKFVMSAYIPKINYLSFLDYYNTLGMTMVIVVIVENFFISTLFFESSEVPDQVDKVFGIVFVSSWISLHGLIVIGEKLKLFHASWESIKDSNNDHVQVKAIVADVQLK